MTDITNKAKRALKTVCQLFLDHLIQLPPRINGNNTNGIEHQQTTGMLDIIASWEIFTFHDSLNPTPPPTDNTHLPHKASNQPPTNHGHHRCNVMNYCITITRETIKNEGLKI